MSKFHDAMAALDTEIKSTMLNPRVPKSEPNPLLDRAKDAVREYKALAQVPASA